MELTLFTFYVELIQDHPDMSTVLLQSVRELECHQYTYYKFAEKLMENIIDETLKNTW